jgi:putative ABC transport system permease protein
MNVVTRGMRNTFRNATRTVSIVVILGLSIGLSFVMLIAHQAVNDKIKTTLGAIGNTVNVTPTGFMAGSDANNALKTSKLRQLASLPHVIGLTQALTDHLDTEGMTSRPKSGSGGSSVGQDKDEKAKTSLKSPAKLNSSGSGLVIAGGRKLPDNFSLPVPIVGTDHPLDPSNIQATSMKITQGKAFDGAKDASEAMISSAMAKKNNVKVGSTFTAYGKKLKVVAIFESNTSAGDSYIITSLPTEQRLSGQKGVVTSAVVTADSLTHLSDVTSAVKKKLGSVADVTSNLEQANRALAPLNTVKAISVYSLAGSVFAGAIIILLTMIMIVRERRREIGILKAIGGSNLRIMGQFMSEALTFTLLGAALGLILGSIGGSPVTAALVNSSSNAGSKAPGGGMSVQGSGFSDPTLGDIANVQAHIGWDVILYGLGAAVLIALIGSAVASYFISKVRPAEVLRSE